MMGKPLIAAKTSSDYELPLPRILACSSTYADFGLLSRSSIASLDPFILSWF
jgi:hypothetical protein